MNKNPSTCANGGSNEYIDLANSESMASKTCPICKNFTSASNTTLNAHIDQCLSVDTATKPNTRHRVKPRRVRTMSDIYSTAKRCTLDEIDDRKGKMLRNLPSVYDDEQGSSSMEVGLTDRNSPLSDMEKFRNGGDDHDQTVETETPTCLDPNIDLMRNACTSRVASSPVLRLMGKDLMVVNHGEEEAATCPQFLDPSRTSKSSLSAPLHPSSYTLLLQSPYAGTHLYFDTCR